MQPKQLLLASCRRWPVTYVRTSDHLPKYQAGSELTCLVVAAAASFSSRQKLNKWTTKERKKERKRKKEKERERKDSLDSQ